MEKILLNLALIDAINFCRANSIDCSGSHLVKYPRRWTYALCRDADGRAIVTVTFYKDKAPMHIIGGDAKPCPVCGELTTLDAPSMHCLPF